MPKLRRKSVSNRKEESKLLMREARQKAETERFNIQPEENGGSDSGVLIVSDGGLARPAFSSNDGIAPSRPSVSNSFLMVSNSCPFASDCALMACKKSFGAEFIESSETDFLKTHTDFAEAFAEAFPDIVVKSQPRNNEELPERKEVANTELNKDDKTLFCDNHFEFIDSEYQVVTQPSPLPWNADQIIFGSFHQNDERFVDQSRGFQCTCNAVCMLIHDEKQNSSVLDQILYDGNTMYNHTVNSLKAKGRFVNSLLSLEEIPDTLEIKSGQYFVEKKTQSLWYSCEYFRRLSFANTSFCFRKSLSQIHICPSDYWRCMLCHK